MKLMNKLFATLVLLGVSNAAFGHDYTFKNDTGRSISVTVETLNGPTKTATISSGGQDMFIFEGKHCLSGVKVNGERASISSSKSRCQSINDFYISGTAGNYTVRARS